MSGHINKIKAIDPQIIVDGNIDKPYYSIRYYDTSDNIWHIGFSSYELKFVVDWLKTEFDIVESEIEPVRHGKWEFINQATNYLESPTGDMCKCSECNFKIDVSETLFKYCPNCGAEMNQTVKNISIT